MDFITTKTWSELNVIIDESFRDSDLDLGLGDSNTINPMKMMKALTGFISGGRVNWSGSIPENVSANPLLRNAWEADILEEIFNVSYDAIQHLFEKVSDEPGYIRLIYDESIGYVGEELDIKQVTHPHYLEPALYVVPSSRSILFQKVETRDPSVNSSKNVIVQSLFDTFHIGEFMQDCQVNAHGPVITGETGDCAYIFNDFQQVIEQPKKALFKFLDNLGTRVVENRKRKEIRCGNNEQLPEKCGFANDSKKITVKKGIHPSVKVSMDVCPAIKLSGWPRAASEFLSRHRKWPNVSLLQTIMDEGFHLVYKPLDPHSSSSVEWRISFSSAEYILLNNLNGFQLKCYRILKTIYYCSLTMPKVLCSYHLKNIFLWACERLPSEFWVECNLAQIVLGLLDDLLHCLATRTCRHFFIPENNLFAHIHEDFLDRIARLVSEIRRHPERLSLVANAEQKVMESLSISDTDTSLQESLHSNIADIELD